MTEEHDELVFKALTDPHRRRILDILRRGPSTTGDLAAEFEDIGRCAVMKHLATLNRAGLVLFRREGRYRFNYLNPVPIRQIYDGWLTPFIEPLVAGVTNLKGMIESDDEGVKE